MTIVLRNAQLIKGVRTIQHRSNGNDHSITFNAVHPEDHREYESSIPILDIAIIIDNMGEELK